MFASYLRYNLGRRDASALFLTRNAAINLDQTDQGTQTSGYAADRRVKSSGRRHRWAITFLILGLGLIPRLVGYNFQLPYINYYDEAWLFWSTMSWRGVYPVQTTLASYPPGILLVDGLAQYIVEQRTHDWTINHISEAVALSRLFSVGVNLLTAAVIGLLARRIAGDWAGWLAMAIWLIPQQIIEQSIQAMPTSWVMLFSALGLYWAIVALDSDWVGFPLLSIAAALASIAFKYTEAPMLIFGFIASLKHLVKPRDPANRAVRSRVLVAQIGLVTVYSLWLFGGLSRRRTLQLPVGSHSYRARQYEAHICSPGKYQAGDYCVR